jgi:fibronectin-binding autotransporter adhesin
MAIFAGSGLSVVFLIQSAHGAVMTDTWIDSSGDGNWNNVANWSTSPGQVPLAGDTVVFSNPALIASTDNDSITSGTGVSFNFSNGAGHVVSAAAATNLSVANVTVSDTGSYGLNWSAYGSTGTSTKGLLIDNAPTYSIASGGTLTLTGPFSGYTGLTPTITKSGTGTLALNNQNGGGTYLNLAASAGLTQLGGTTNDLYEVSSIANGATVQLAANNPIQSGTTSYAIGILGISGTLDLHGFTQDFNNFGGTSTGIITNNSPTPTALTLGRTDSSKAPTSGTFAGTITDGTSGGIVSLVVNSTTSPTSITYDLTGDNTYSGGTTVTAGLLTAGHDGALGSGNVSVASGATLQQTGGTLNNYIADTAILSLGATAVDNLNYTGTADTIAGLIINGIDEPDGTWGSSTSGASNTSSVFTGSGIIDVAPVSIPEPASLASVAIIGGAALIGRRRKSSRAAVL